MGDYGEFQLSKSVELGPCIKVRIRISSIVIGAQDFKCIASDNSFVTSSILITYSTIINVTAVLISVDVFKFLHCAPLFVTNTQN